jgi:hypothetical protein
MTIALSTPVFLPLAVTRMRELSLQYREQSSANSLEAQLWFSLIPVIAVGLGILIYKIYNQPRPVVNTPSGMLDELCRAHEFDHGSRKLLVRIAADADLPQPATMLVAPAAFERAVEAARTRGRYDGHHRAMLKQLRRRLFGG